MPKSHIAILVTLFVISGCTILLGALAKLEHWWWASYALIVGMCTEAFIFTLLGILPPHKDYYWEKLYPGLDDYHSFMS